MLSCAVTSQDNASSRERWTLRELLDWTSEKFDSIGIEQGRTDAQYLLAHALGCSRMDLYLQLDRLLDSEERSSFRELVKRRLAREPVAYIEGRRGFHGLDLDLLVGPAVLIPRPETEHLVDWALGCIDEGDECAKVLDVGTGSGAIALAIKRSRPQVQVTAIDVSPDALEVAKENAKRLELEVTFQQGSLLSDVASGAKFDLICANLPYIPGKDIPTLAPEVRDHEPTLALDGGEDGLRLIDTMLEQIASGQHLCEGGSVLLEFGIGQADDVERSCKRHGLLHVVRRRDYAEIDRVIRASAEPFASSVDASSVTLEPDPDPRTLAMEALAKADDADPS